jgi:uncharacterized RDD family membrane protein YckC
MSEPTGAPEPAADPPPPVRWAVPTAVAEVPGAPGLAFADVASRIAAFLVDVLIVGIVGVVVVLALGHGERVYTERASFVWVSSWTVNVAVALLGSAYFTFFWSGGRRATIGQRMLAIQVGNAFDGRPLTFGQAGRRWLGYGIFLGLLAVVPSLRGFATLAQTIWIVVLLASIARSPMKQGLHDRFAHSALVRPANRASGGPAMACLIVLIVLGFLFVAGVALLIYAASPFVPQAPPGTTI